MTLLNRSNRIPQQAHRNRRLKALFIIPLAALTLGMVFARPVMAQDSPGRILSITGRGTESAPTSATQVSLGVQVNAETAEAAQAEAAERSTRLIEKLRSEQVDELETTGISLNPRYDYSSDRQQLVGYTATNTVSFEVPTERAGTLLDELVQSGATNINGISFVASDEAIATAQQQAIRDAIEDARTQAAVVLEALGFEMEEIVGVQVNGAGMPRPVPLPNARAEALSADAASTPVVGQEQEVNASVTLQIRY